MKLTRPNFFQVVLGSLVLALKERFTRRRISPPAKLGKYSLVKKIAKRYQFKNTFVAIYRHQRKKYLVKFWRGRIHDMKYFFLVDEFLSTEILYHLTKNNFSVGFKVPRPIEVLRSKHSFASVYEFVPGQSLTRYTRAYQARVISKIITGLTALSGQLNARTRSSFPTRRPFLYLLTFPIIALVLLITNPEELIVILSSATLSFLPLAGFFTNRLSLSHRDLTPANVIISHANPYLLDSENLVLTIPGYDLAYLGSLPSYASISKLLQKRFHLKAPKPLQAYITLHQSLGSKSHARPYLTYLHQLFK